MLDGKAHSVDDRQGCTMTAALHDGALVTELRAEGLPVQRVRRVVHEDMMTVTQSYGDAQTVCVYRRARVKQVIAYRRDLAMRKGKIAAQVAHASMAVLLGRDQGTVDKLVVPLHGPVAAWVHGAFAKVVLSVQTEQDLLTVHREASLRGLPTALITDSGRTEFGGVPTRTAVAVGPWVAEVIDAITGPEGLVETKLA